MLYFSSYDLHSESFNHSIKKNPPGKPRHRWDRIRRGIKEIGVVVEWTGLNQEVSCKNWWWKSSFHKIREISRLDKGLLASQEGLWAMELGCLSDFIESRCWNIKCNYGFTGYIYTMNVNMLKNSLAE